MRKLIQKTTKQLQKTFDNYALIATSNGEGTLQMIGNLGIVLQAFLGEDFEKRVTDEDLDHMIRFFDAFTKILKKKRKRG